MELFKDGLEIGLNIAYQEQSKPEDITQAFIIGEDLIGKDSVWLIP